MFNESAFPNKEFFDNVGLITTIDSVCQRYHILPTELMQMSMFDFSLNIAISLKATIEENELRKKATKPEKSKDVPWSALGFDYKAG